MSRYLNEYVSDRHHKQYKVVYPITEIDDYQTFSTDSAHYIKIFNDGATNTELKSRYEWIAILRDLYGLSDDLVFPNRLLDLPDNDFGYVTARVLGGTTIRKMYCVPPKHDFVKWYFDETGGFKNRIDSALLLISCLENIHKHGLAISDLSPDNIIQYSESEGELTLKILFADSLSSYSYPSISNGIPGYIDPLVFNGLNSISSISDTYSFAVTLFELLFGSHPFIGDACDGMAKEEINILIDSGKLSYIGDNSVEENWNEKFEDLELVFPDEIKSLFKRMFCDGKLDVYKRPSISEFKVALDKMYLDIFKCHKCGREYVSRDSLCPFCRTKSLDLYIEFYTNTCSNQDFFLPSEDCVYNKVSHSEIVNSYVLKHDYTLNMAKDFLRLPMDLEESGTLSILLSSAKKCITIVNQFENFNLKIINEDNVDGRILPKGQSITMNFQYISKRRIELIPNSKVISCLEFDDDVYGHVTQAYGFTVEVRNYYAK